MEDLTAVVAATMVPTSFPSRGRPAPYGLTDPGKGGGRPVSVDGSPPEGEKDPDQKAYRRRLAELALKAALAAALRILFEKLWQ